MNTMLTHCQRVGLPIPTGRVTIAVQRSCLDPTHEFSVHRPLGYTQTPGCSRESHNWYIARVTVSDTGALSYRFREDEVVTQPDIEAIQRGVYVLRTQATTKSLVWVEPT